jgi:Holliday junction resolvase
VPINSRQKGCRAERDVAGMLERWWRELEPGCRFVRTPSSGGWSTGDVRAEFRASGDVMTMAKHFPFTVEIKHRVEWSWDRLRAGKASPVWKWWRQAQAQGVEQGLEPMLWMRHDREDWRVMVRAGLGMPPGAPCDFAWDPALWRSVGDVGDLPVLYLAEVVLAVPPAFFVYPPC